MFVLILDRAHAVLLDADRLPDVPLAGERPMHAVETAFARRGLALPSPCGSRVRAEGGRDFVFLIDRVAAPTGMSWRPLREVATNDLLWQLYLELVLGGYTPPTRALDVWSFGNTPEMAAKLVHLVACGTKRVTMGWIAAAERDGTPLAYEDGVSIVTDGFGYPRVCLRSVEVRVMRFDEVTASDAAGEGEGDLSYADWREGHSAYFSGEAERHDLVFDEGAQIAVERFEVLHVIGRADR
jgi:uncharacterized protein YhfF